MFLFIILNGRISRPRERAGKENEQTLANMCPAEEATCKDDVEIEKYLQVQKQKTLNTRLRAIWTRGINFVSHWKSLEQLKSYLPMSSTFFCPNVFISVRKENDTEYGTLSGFQRSFERYFLVWPYNKHLINRARSVCRGESWPRSLVQTESSEVYTGDLGHDSPIQTSCSVNKDIINPDYVAAGSLAPQPRPFLFLEWLFWPEKLLSAHL